MAWIFTHVKKLIRFAEEQACPKHWHKKNVNVYTHTLSLSLTHMEGGGVVTNTVTPHHLVRPSITFALGPRQATVTIPYSSSSVGYLMTSSALWGNGGTGLCHGRVKGPRKPWTGRKRSGQTDHLACNASQWQTIWLLTPVKATDR